VNGLLDRLRTALGGLAPRERLLLGATAATLLFAILWLAVLMPAIASVRDAETRVASAERDLEMARRLQTDLAEVQGRVGNVERRIREGPKGNIFTTLEELAQKSAVKVDSMEPQAAPAHDRYKETKVQVVLKGVTLAQAVSFLHGIESAPQLLSVKSLRVRTRTEQKEDMLDVTFTVSSFEMI
jgi:type II secretory pathway component PulM